MLWTSWLGATRPPLHLAAAWQVRSAAPSSEESAASARVFAEALAALRAAPGAPLTRQAHLGAHAPTAGLLRGGDSAEALALPSPPPPHGLSPLLPNSNPTRFYVIVGEQESWLKYVSEEYFHLFAHLRNTFGWHVLTQNAFKDEKSGAEMSSMFKRKFGRAPDVMLIMEYVDDMVRLREMSPDLPDTALWLFLDDLHFGHDDANNYIGDDDAKRQKKRAGILAADLVLGAYTYELDLFYPEAAAKPRAWIPHGASSNFQLPMRPASATTRAVFLSGSTEAKWYPYRAMIEKMIQGGDERFVQHRHPGYFVEHDAASATRAAVGSSYAALLNSHLACVTDGSDLDYAVAKIFEIPAAGCLLLVNNEMAPHLLPLGFVPGVHYLTFTAESLSDVVDAVLDERNSAAIDEIRAQGQALVWSRHTVAHRAAAMHELAGAVARRAPAAAPALASGSAHVIDDTARACLTSLTRAALAQPRSDTVDIIIFSKDRPLRLLSLLESQMARVVNQGSVAVVFDGSEPAHLAAYAIVADLFPGVLFVSEADFAATDDKSRFQLAVESVLSRFSAPYIASIVDEMIWLRETDLAQVAAYMAASAAGAATSFQLRMGMALSHIEDAKPTLVPPAPSSAEADPRVHCYTWTSPDMSPPTAAFTTIVGAAVFDARRLVADWAALRYAHPGQLEGRWYSSRPSYSLPCAHLFFEEAAIANFETTIKVREDLKEGDSTKDSAVLERASTFVQMGLHLDYKRMTAARQLAPYPHSSAEPASFLPFEVC